MTAVEMLEGVVFGGISGTIGGKAAKPAGAPAAEATATDAASRKRDALLRHSDAAVTLDRPGLTVPEGVTFKAWEPF